MYSLVPTGNRDPIRGVRAVQKTAPLSKVGWPLEGDLDLSQAGTNVRPS